MSSTSLFELFSTWSIFSLFLMDLHRCRPVIVGLKII